MVYKTSNNNCELLNDSPVTEFYGSHEHISKAEKTKGENRPSITSGSALGDSKLSKNVPQKEKQKVIKAESKFQNSLGADCVKIVTANDNNNNNTRANELSTIPPDKQVLAYPLLLRYLSSPSHT